MKNLLKLTFSIIFILSFAFGINGNVYANEATTEDEIATTESSPEVTVANDLKGIVIKNGVVAYEAGLTLYKKVGSTYVYVANTVATEADGYNMSKVIKDLGTYKLQVDYIMSKDGTCESFYVDDETAIFQVTELSASNIIEKNINYLPSLDDKGVFSGTLNYVISDIQSLNRGDNANIIIQYKNNGSTEKNVIFTVNTPSDVVVLNGEKQFQLDVKAGESGIISVPIRVYNFPNNYNSLTIPITATVDNKTYNFGTVLIKQTGFTLKANGFVKTNKAFMVYGEADEGTSIKIKNADTNEIYAIADTKERWYSASIILPEDGKYSLVAEISTDNSVRSNIIEVVAKSDAILVDAVRNDSYSTGLDIAMNPYTGNVAFATWADTDLKGRNITMSTKFTNSNKIVSVYYEFSNKRYLATKYADGYYTANLVSWVGIGRKPVKAIVTTIDGDEYEYFVAEVTICFDKTGFVNNYLTKEVIKGATVTCEQLNQDGTWTIWNGEPYGQLNPQVTNYQGGFAYMLPEGTYRIKVSYTRYESYVTTKDTVKPSNNTIVMPSFRNDIDVSLYPQAEQVKLTINKTSLLLYFGGSGETLTTTINETVPVGTVVKWTSSNTDVANVSSTGKVSPVSVGTSVITATVNLSGNVYTATCDVTVKRNENQVSPSPTPSESTTASGNSNIIILPSYNTTTEASATTATTESSATTEASKEESTEILRGLQTINNNLYYYTSAGKMVQSVMMVIGNDTYYFGSNGIAITSTIKILDGKIYYFGEDGKMIYSKLKSVGGKKYYFGEDGYAMTGLQTIKNNKYFFNKKTCVMIKSKFKTINKKTYYFGANGKSVVGLKTIKKNKYYFNSKGVMQTSKFIMVDGKKYCFDASGKAMVGFKQINGAKYYFYEDGTMAVSTKIKINGKVYNFGSDGRAD